MLPQKPKFSADDTERAADQWGCNCGPGAIAAIMGMTLDDVRFFMGDFEKKHYTNPTLMFQTLDGISWNGLCEDWTKRSDLDWPDYGLARIQWEGPWTKPGVPMRARYRYTHWVGTCRRGAEVGVWDINMLGNGTGWGSLEHWRTILVPWLLKELHPKADGKWHITHSIEVEPLSAMAA